MTLAHILWALAHDTKLQRALHGVLEAHGFPKRLDKLEQIPLLQACVKEGVRWAGAAAAMLPRVTPVGGVELDGRYIPEGVRGGIQPDTLLSPDHCHLIPHLVPARCRSVPPARSLRPVPLGHGGRSGVDGERAA
jgi:hypothetical protein